MESLQMDINTMEKMMLRRAASMQRPINGSLELLPLCNMRCDMCYVRLDRSETGPSNAESGRAVSAFDGRRASFVSGISKAVPGAPADGDDPDN